MNYHRSAVAEKTIPSQRLSDYSEIPTYEHPIGTFVSLYAGAGGLDIGFVLAGFVPVWVSELDESALKTHDKALKRLAEERPHLVGHTHMTRAGDLLSVPSDELPMRGRLIWSLAAHHAGDLSRHSYCI